MGCIQSSHIKVNEIKNNENIINGNEIENNNKKTTKTNQSSFQISNSSHLENEGNNIDGLINIKIKEINSNYHIINQISKNENLIEYQIQSKNNLNLFKSLKILNKKFLNKNASDEKIIEEIKLLSLLNHEKIIKVENNYYDENYYYIITEYCKLGNLYNLKKKNNFNENQIKFIIYQLLTAVQYLCSKNFIHSDIKPINILIEKSFKYKGDEYYYIKILDFTCKNNIKSSKIKNSEINLPYYTSPEILDMDFNSKCDIWSIGIILYEMLYGYLPFKGKTFEEIINNIKNSNITYDKKLISQNALNLLKKMLVRDYEKRLSANECLNHIWFENIEEIKPDETNEIELTQSKEENDIKNNNNNKSKKQLKNLFKYIINDLNLVNKDHLKRISVSSGKMLNQKNNNLKNDLVNETIKFIHHYNRRKYEINEEMEYLRNLFNKYKVNEEISCDSIIYCFKLYTGFNTNLVNDLICDERIYYKLNNEMNKMKLNLIQFQNFLMKEKSDIINESLWKVFSNLSTNNRNDLLYCCNSIHSSSKYKKYFLEIKKEINEHKLKENYLFFEYKNLIEKVVEKIRD